MKPIDKDEIAVQKGPGKLTSMLDRLPSGEACMLFSLRCLAIAQILCLMQILLQHISRASH
jgi:hypothetical protein